jgi:hypothetical protein
MLNKEEVLGKKQEGRSKREEARRKYFLHLSLGHFLPRTLPHSDHLPSAITDNLYA